MFPSGGGLGVPPSNILPPLLEERGTGGEVNRRWDRPMSPPIYQVSPQLLKSPKDWGTQEIDEDYLRVSL